MSLRAVRAELRTLGNQKKADFLRGYFLPPKPGYRRNDRFRGVRVPVTRKLALQYRDLPLREVISLLASTYHEDRLLALIILTDQFKRGDKATQRQIYDLYLNHRRHINNWDLVDASAHLILGPYLNDRSRGPLMKLSRSASLWDRRMAVIASYHFIKQGDFASTLALAKILLHDEEDLVQKAVGWMLREIGNRDRATEEEFLQAFYKVMPRTMLRYAIEKFPAKRRKAYLEGRV